MAQFSVNIPNHKVQSFLTTMAQTGFTKTIQSIQLANSSAQQMQLIPNQNQHNQHHPYFDWDFYTNDILID
jgi:hypothetical protein